jgi:hypothetical protein
VARRDIEKFQEISVNKNHRTYQSRFIRDETRGMDLHIGTTESSNRTALEVAYTPPGIERKIKKILETVTLPPTQSAVLVSKVESWMTRVPA